MPTVSISWSYTTDELVTATLADFHVFPVDDSHARLAPPIEVLPENIPTPTSPLAISLPAGATKIEVVPVDIDGYEGVTSYLPIQTGLPSVLDLSQIMIVMVVSGG